MNPIKAFLPKWWERRWWWRWCSNDGKIKKRSSCQSGFSPLVRKKVEKVARASECKTLSFLLFLNFWSTIQLHTHHIICFAYFSQKFKTLKLSRQTYKYHLLVWCKPAKSCFFIGCKTKLGGFWSQNPFLLQENNVLIFLWWGICFVIIAIVHYRRHVQKSMSS